VKDFKDPI